MAKQTNKAQLLKDMLSERRRLEKNLSLLCAEDMIRPGITGAWSVKDILAHLVAWERLFLDWYFTGVQGCIPEVTPVGMGQKAIDVLNQQIYERNQGRSLDEILTEFHASYQEIVTIIATIPEEDMFVHGRFSWTDRLTLADYIAGNTCNHYAWAKSQIRKRAKHQASEDKLKDVKPDSGKNAYIQASEVASTSSSLETSREPSVTPVSNSKPRIGQRGQITFNEKWKLTTRIKDVLEQLVKFGVDVYSTRGGSDYTFLVPPYLSREEYEEVEGLMKEVGKAVKRKVNYIDWYSHGTKYRIEGPKGS